MTKISKGLGLLLIIQIPSILLSLSLFILLFVGVDDSTRQADFLNQTKTYYGDAFFSHWCWVIALIGILIGRRMANVEDMTLKQMRILSVSLLITILAYIVELISLGNQLYLFKHVKGGKTPLYIQMVLVALCLELCVVIIYMMVEMALGRNKLAEQPQMGYSPNQVFVQKPPMIQPQMLSQGQPPYVFGQSSHGALPAIPVTTSQPNLKQ